MFSYLDCVILKHIYKVGFYQDLYFLKQFLKVK